MIEVWFGFVCFFCNTKWHSKSFILSPQAHNGLLWVVFFVKKSDFKCSTQGFQTFTQHSVINQYKVVSKKRFGENKTQKIFSSTSLTKAFPRPSLTLDALLESKVSAAEAVWAFKVTEEDFTLQDCDYTPLLFKNIFPDSSTC